jgi:hypothetical protein
MLRFVPYLGSILAALAPLGLAAAVDPGWSRAAYVALLFVVVEPVTGYAVEPLLYGHSTGLSPISVVVAAIFWTWLWGPIGLILSTPLTLCLVVVGRHSKALEFVDVLLGDRPALPAVDRFYQRILANDPDEILAQAEAYVAEHSLLEYYDCVVLPGLTLAAQDEARGALDAQRAVGIGRSMMTVVGELGRLTAAPAGGAREIPPPRKGAVLCVPGRRCLDEVASAMLQQVLQGRGYATRAIPHHAVSREEIDRLDLAGVAAIAIMSFGLAGAPPHLRYLVARLRQHAPEATLVIGLWPAGAAASTDADTQRAVGADRYARSLGEAVDAIAAKTESPRSSG